MTTPTAATVAGIAIPDTALVHDVTDFIREVKNELLFQALARLECTSACARSGAARHRRTRTASPAFTSSHTASEESHPPQRTPHFSRRVGVTTAVCSTSIRFARPWGSVSGFTGSIPSIRE